MTQATAAVEVGSPAPAFALRDQHGQDVSGASLLGSPALLIFYPYAFTRVCGGEWEMLRERADELVGVSVIGVSTDPLFSIRAYHESLQLPFTLLSDFWPHGEVASAYGVFDPSRGVAFRSSFLLDKAGVIRWAVHSPEAQARSIDAYVEAVGAL